MSSSKCMKENVTQKCGTRFGTQLPPCYEWTKLGSRPKLFLGLCILGLGLVRIRVSRVRVSFHGFI